MSLGMRWIQARIQGRWNGWIFTPLFLSPLLSFLLLIPQILIGSNTLLQKFTPHFKILDPRLGLSPRHRLNGSRGGCTLSNSTHRSGYRVGFWIRQLLIFECNCRRWAKHDFSTIVKSEYRGNQIQEGIFRFLLIIWSQALAHCFRFLAG